MGGEIARLERGQRDDAGRLRLGAESLDESLKQASGLVLACSSLFSGWAQGFKANHNNELPKFDDSVSMGAGGDRVRVEAGRVAFPRPSFEGVSDPDGVREALREFDMFANSRRFLASAEVRGELNVSRE